MKKLLELNLSTHPIEETEITLVSRGYCTEQKEPVSPGEIMNHIIREYDSHIYDDMNVKAVLVKIDSGYKLYERWMGKESTR